MGTIKTALEIALERTEAVRGDKASIGLFEAKRRGKRLANGYLAGESSALADAIKAAPEAERESLRQGAFDVLLAQLTLPVTEEDERRLDLAGKGLSVIIADRRFDALFRQFSGAVSQYIDETARFTEAVKRQYAPKLRQKEEELSRRFGREVRIDPLQDPEFIAFFNQNMGALRANYEGLIDQIRGQARLLFTGEG